MSGRIRARESEKMSFIIIVSGLLMRCPTAILSQLGDAFGSESVWRMDKVAGVVR